MSATIRRRRPVANIVQDLDAFPKIPETVQEDKKFSGGAVAIACFVLISWLVVGELLDYLSAGYKYSFDVDTEFDSKLDINVDLTVASDCMGVSADVIDSADSAISMEGKLELQPSNFEMSDKHRAYWDLLKRAAMESGSSTAESQRPRNPLESLSWFPSVVRTQLEKENFKEASRNQDGNQDACRIHGSIQVNKIAGNMHVTAGKSLGLAGGHLHINIIFTDSGPTNFSHRIEKLSFCSDHQNLINTLDGTEKISTNELELFQYYIKIVPTKVHHSSGVVTACQYAVTERRRVISHSSGSHGMPGIFLKYDLSPLSINVYEKRQPLWKFTVRLCAIIGGVYATSGVLNLIISLLLGLVTCRLSKHREDGFEKRRLNSEETAALFAHQTQEVANGPSERFAGSAFQT